MKACIECWDQSRKQDNVNATVVCCWCLQVELKHKYKVRIFMDESVSFGTLGATGHGVTEHLNVPVCRFCCTSHYIAKTKRFPIYE